MLDRHQNLCHPITVTRKKIPVQGPFGVSCKPSGAYSSGSDPQSRYLICLVELLFKVDQSITKVHCYTCVASWSYK